MYILTRTKDNKTEYCAGSLANFISVKKNLHIFEASQVNPMYIGPVQLGDYIYQFIKHQ